MSSTREKDYILRLFSSDIYFKGDNCHYCKTSKKSIEYRAGAQTAYSRSHSTNYYFFCSESCKTIYKNKFICRKCGYDEDLIQPEGEEFVLCTDYPYELSCYEKYLREKHPELVCSFCDSTKESPLPCRGKFYYCHDCFHKIEQLKGTIDKESVCFICDRESSDDDLSDLTVVNDKTICLTCLEKYRKFILIEESKE